MPPDPSNRRHLDPRYIAITEKSVHHTQPDAIGVLANSTLAQQSPESTCGTAVPVCLENSRFLGTTNPIDEIRIEGVARVDVPGVGGLFVEDAVRIRVRLPFCSRKQRKGDPVG